MVIKSHITDPSLFENWLRERKGLSESSIYTYLKSIERFLVSDPDLENLEDYNKFLVEVSIKKRCTHFYSAIRSFIEFKIADASTKNKLLDGLVKPKMRNDLKRERKHLSEDELLNVINYLEEEKHRIIALIQMLTGVRAGDVFRLKYGQIVPEVYKGDPTLKLVITGKGEKRNVVYIHDKVAQQLIMNYVTNNFGEDDYYFLNYSPFKARPGTKENEFTFTKMNYLRFWRDLKQALQIAGVDKEDFATHDFRRCFARRFWERFKDVHKLQQVLNHRDPKVTLRYLEQSGLHNIDYHFEMQNT